MRKTDRSPTNHHASRDFKRTLVATLNARGIYFHGSTWLPSAAGDFANGERGYQLNDNGTHRVRTYAQIRAMAEEAHGDDGAASSPDRAVETPPGSTSPR